MNRIFLKISLLFIVCCQMLLSQGIRIIDNKGTLRSIEQSKWTQSGNNIYNKNTGNVGIGNTNPANKLEITQGTAGNSGLRFTNLPNANFLSTNANGDVISTATTLLPIIGDVTGSIGATVVQKIQGNSISNIAPIASQVLAWNSGTNAWTPTNNPSSSNWLITGNNNITSSNFLGTTNDIKMQIRSNNTTMLEFGRRQTLGLYDSSSSALFPYNQANASVVYVRGTGGTSTLQFEANNANFYKPIIFTDSHGNFMMRGSSAGTDFFEIGSNGTTNGELQFTIGDDGNEPIIFRKYNYSSSAYVELMRMQGNGLNNNVRVGVNTSGSMANSTLQIIGSVSNSIASISASTTLDESYHTIVITSTNSFTITLPDPSTCNCTGRMYIIKKASSTGTVHSSPSFINSSGVSTSSFSNGAATHLQNDGTSWQQIN